MPRVELVIAPPAAASMQDAIRQADGCEVYFLGRVQWEEGEVLRARLAEVEILARGNHVSVPAIVDRAEDWDVALHNHPSGDLRPSDADVGVASELGNRGVGFAIVDNTAERCWVVVPPFRRPERRRVEPEEIRAALGRGGSVARALEGYEPRSGQIDLALEVARSLDEKAVVACEAGTGVGKSFAYLVPAILWATANRERVVVSTGTIHLQEQLVDKDLPFLAEALDVDFRFALAKGRGNYACRRKLAELPEELALAPPTEEERKALDDIASWAESTRDGSLADLPATPPASVWERVKSESDRSLKVNCKFYHECFFYEARRKAYAADVLVVNHHLFFADLAVRRATGNYRDAMVLPPYSRVIFDEAHHVEDVCAEHFSVDLGRAGVRRGLRRMASKDGRRGRVAVLAQKLRTQGDASAATVLENGYARKLPETTVRIDACFERIEQLLAAREGPGAGSAQGAEASRIRWRPEDSDDPFWSAVREQLSGVRAELAGLAALNDRAITVLERAAVRRDSLPALRLDLESFRGRIEHWLEGIDRFLQVDDASRARWIDPSRGRSPQRPGEVAFSAVPVRVADELRDALYERLETVVLTSATLSVEGNSRFLADRLGLDLVPEPRYRFSSHPSPFDFPRQVLTVVPRDLPEPGSPDFDARLPGAVLEILRASRGRAFVLFTSYALLRRVHARLERPLLDLGIRPLAQGDASRSELLSRFRQGSCALFGTDSFWEGVDVKGRALECVIITRLPFRVPTDPLNEARVEEVQRRGLHPFTHLAVPQAVLRFKQGFGRLVRSSTDRGVVAILDSRVTSRPYGRTFLRSLPPTRVVSGSLSESVREVGAFFAPGERAGGPAPGVDASARERRDEAPPERPSAPASPVRRQRSSSPGGSAAAPPPWRTD